MNVDPMTSASHVHDGQTYYFCHPGCLTKFRNDPNKYLSGHVEAMTHSLAVSTPVKPGTRYICPMDPEVESDRPGPCPKCGMALEPAMPSADDDSPDPEYVDMRRRFGWGLALGVPVFLAAMLDMLPGHPISHTIGNLPFLILQLILTIPVVFWCGWPFMVRAWQSIVNRSPNMFTLIAIGVLMAFGYSLAALAHTAMGGGLFPEAFTMHGMVEPYFETAAAIIVLVLLGQVMELRARRQTGEAVRALLRLTPKTAKMILPGGREEDVPIELIQVGDRVRVRPGEKVPIDGVVVEGHTTIDESMITGEPIPIEKSTGSKVVAGTLNGTGSLIVEAVAVGDHTLVAGIVRTVLEAQRSRMPLQRLVDRVASWFVPIVLLIAVATFVIWAIAGQPIYGLVSAVSVLIIACPCAMGLATPMAIMVGTGRGATLGVLFRNAEALERLSEVDTLAFDKTGTLTEGRPTVTGFETVEGFQPNDMLQLAASVEQGSEHPLGAAIVRAARERHLGVIQSTNVQTVSGRGLRGTVNGQTIVLGNAAFLLAENIVGEPSRRRMEDLSEEGLTVLFVGIDGHYAGLIAVEDPIRSTTREAVEGLKKEGVRLVVLSGDGRTTTKVVAEELGIAEMHPEVMPSAKREVIMQLQKEGRIVAMAGDGINDAPALAQADIGIAMGCGTDVAIASAPVTLVRPDLRAILTARKLSRATLRIIRQNLILAFGYNVVAIPIAAGALTLFGGGTLSPVWAALAMSFSSLAVVGNSLRLRRMV